MIFQIAWRNIWRSPIRSLVVIVAVALGLWAGLFMVSFSMGMMEQRSRDQIETEISHIQVHNPIFSGERDAEDTLSQGNQILTTAQTNPSVRSATGRTLSQGMLTSPRKSAGVMINGILPATEASTTQLEGKLVEGTYFGKRRNEILISQKSAEEMGVGIRKKVVLTFQDVEGEMTSAAFRIVGIYRTINTQFDKANVFVKAEDLQRLLKAPGAFHEIALLAHDGDQVLSIQETLANQYEEAKVENWKEISPQLRMMSESMDQYLWIFVGIIMLALSFGIVNTMLMAVLERTHELGMLMAVGMTKGKVFRMIMLETMFLTSIGAPIGLLAAYFTIGYFGNIGIDLSAFAEGMSEFGMSSIIYTYLDPNYYWQVMILVAVSAILSAIYPALKALRLKPVEAIRAI